jgi:hypothetical protein
MTRKEYIDKILAVNLTIVQSYLDGDYEEVKKLREIMGDLIFEAIEKKEGVR